MGCCKDCGGELEKVIPIQKGLTGDDLLKAIYDTVQTAHPYDSFSTQVGYYGRCEERSRFYASRDEQRQFRHSKQFLDLFNDWDRERAQLWLEQNFPPEKPTEVFRDTGGSLFSSVIRRAKANGDFDRAGAILDYYLPCEHEGGRSRRITAQVLIDIFAGVMHQCAAQLAHDFGGLQVTSQRFQRAHMEGAPPGFIKLSLQIAVDVDALTAIVDDGHKVKFVGGELYPFVPAPLVLSITPANMSIRTCAVIRRLKNWRQNTGKRTPGRPEAMCEPGTRNGLTFLECCEIVRSGGLHMIRPSGEASGQYDLCEPFENAGTPQPGRKARRFPVAPEQLQENGPFLCHSLRKAAQSPNAGYWSMVGFFRSFPSGAGRQNARRHRGSRGYEHLLRDRRRKIAPCTGRELVFDKNVRGELSLKYRVIAA